MNEGENDWALKVASLDVTRTTVISLMPLRQSRLMIVKLNINNVKCTYIELNRFDLI